MADSDILLGLGEEYASAPASDALLASSQAILIHFPSVAAPNEPTPPIPDFTIILNGI